MGWFDSLFGAADEDEAEQREPFGRIVAEPVFDTFREAWKAGAGLFNLFGEEPVKIKEPVGPDAPNRRPDVAKVETFLDRAGHLDLAKTEGPTGYYGSGVAQGIRGFQKDNALAIDGLINPDGETLQRLGAVLSEPEQPSLQATGLSPIVRPTFAQDELPPRMPGPLPAQSTASPLQARVADWLQRREATLGREKNSTARPASVLLPTAAERTSDESRDLCSRSKAVTRTVYERRRSGGSRTVRRKPRSTRISSSRDRIQAITQNVWQFLTSGISPMLMPQTLFTQAEARAEPPSRPSKILSTAKHVVRR